MSKEPDTVGAVFKSPEWVLTATKDCASAEETRAEPSPVTATRTAAHRATPRLPRAAQLHPKVRF